MALGKGLQSLIPPPKRFGIHRETKTDDASGRVWHIPLPEISPNTEQPRKQFSHQELEDLIASIKAHGVLQPILVTEKTDGGYELIAGERRFRASQIAGLSTIPALVRGANKKEKLELALIENIQRQDLNPIEEAFAYQRLLTEFSLTQQEVADQVGKSRPTVANMVRLLELPEPIQKALADGTLSVGKAKVLLSLPDAKQQLAMFHNLPGNAMSVRETESLVALARPRSGKGQPRRDPNVLAQEQLLEERLGAKVRISARGEKGTITIFYHSKEEQKRILQELI
ncbi:MAG: ParB/RepB/Spo0J family partition protein [Candidatus Magasanikbacteria bacterium]|nr:ParB/RepB/Spo0J family partition protein [Candidatus Magasanikbacteria bacterium]